MSIYYVGVDLGQRRDHAAIAVVERWDKIRAYQPPRFEAMVVRYVERILLGTPYPRIVSKIRDLVSAPELVGKCKLVVDATGVGGPVVDMLRNARLGCEMTPVTITGGERAHEQSANGTPQWTVPRQDLISAVHLLLEREELRIAGTMREAPALVKELESMAVSARSRGKSRPGASSGGQHDDLVFAVALACWKAMNVKNIGFGEVRLPGI